MLSGPHRVAEDAGRARISINPLENAHHRRLTGGAGVDSNPRCRHRAYLGGIRPEFGALLRPNNSIRVGEKLFAWG